MSYIFLCNKQWTFHEIRDLGKNKLNALTTFEQQILAPAHAWLNGQQAFTLQTSGSTGKPKSITFSREQIQKSVRQTVRAFNLQTGQLLFCPLAVNYVAGFMMLMRGLVHNMPVYFVEPGKNPISQEILHEKFHFAAFIPLQLKTILEAGGQYQDFINKLDTIILGGGPVDPALADQLQYLHPVIYHTYGMTETLTHVAIRCLNPERWETYQALNGVSFDQDQDERLIIHTPIWEESITTNYYIQLLN